MVKREHGATARPKPSPVHDALMVVADRIYQRDKVRFAKLIVWIRTALRDDWSVDRIRRAMLALNKREAEGKPIDAWWPWLNAALEKVRTRDLEQENEGYKHGQPNRIKAILAKIYKDVEARE